MQMSAQFLRAIGDFKKQLPALQDHFSGYLVIQLRDNDTFRIAFERCFEALTLHFREEYASPMPAQVLERLHEREPDLSREQVMTFLVQHIVLERFLRCVFPDVFSRNKLACLLDAALETVENRAWLSMRVEGLFYYVEREWRECTTKMQRQQLISDVCEHFLNGFDPKLAEAMSVIYTPQEIVDFMCASTVELFQQAYGRSLSEAGAPVFDPCAGIAQFLVNMMSRFDLQALPFKYTHELFGIEIMLWPYFVAVLNMEQTFFELTGRYEPFTGMRYADALA